MKVVKTILLVIIMIANYNLTAQVAINTDGSIANNSAGLDVKFTDKGFLPPRMSAAQRDAISSPAVSLIIYCTDCLELQMYNGTHWVGINIGTATQPNNQAPIVSGLIILGLLEVGQTITGSYTYTDNENNPEGTSLYQWYSADDASGTNQVSISGATTLTYVIDTSDETKYLSFEVTPVTYTGTSPGTVVMSAYQGPIAPWTCGSTLTDVRDSQTYTTVQIGTQCWMAENLNIGNRIPADNEQTNNATLEKYCLYENIAYCDTFGGLYQWDEMMQYSTTPGTQGICPYGWHLPTDTEWMILEEEVESTSGVNWNTTSWRGTDVGGNLKETGFTHWWTPNTGATNSSGFTCLGAGTRNVYTTYYYGYQSGLYYTSTEISTGAWMREISYSHSEVFRTGTPKNSGFSVRCMRD